MTNITVTNTYTDASGAQANGTVSFTPILTATDGASIRFLADPIVAPVVAGQLSVSLVTTDSFIVTGTVTYRVVEKVGSTLRNRKYVSLPSSLGATVVLSSLSSTPTPPNTIVLSGGADLGEELDAIDARIDALEAGTPTATHVADSSDPHAAAGYVTQTDTDALYAAVGQIVPTGGTSGQVLAKQSASDNDVDWEDQAATSITSPFVVTASDVAHVPITAQGMSGQTADLFDVKEDGGAIAFSVAASGQTQISDDPPTLGTLRVGVTGPASRAIAVKLAASHTAYAVHIADNGGTPIFTVDNDGTVAALNIGAKVIVLDNAEAVPGGTPTGTVILRRPA